MPAAGNNNSYRLLLLCLTCAEMMSEGETYSKKLIKIDQLGKDDQVIVKRSGTNEMVGQYFCHNGICNISYCVKCFETESEYLVLIMHNISHLDRFDANLNGGTPFLPNFTLDEDVSSTSTTTAFYDANLNEDVSSTSAATAVSDETHIQGIKTNEPLHTTENPEADTGEPLSIEAKVAISIGVIGAIVALVIALAIADIAIAKKAGRDAITTKAFRYLRGRFHNREPNQQVQNPREMDRILPNPNEV